MLIRKADLNAVTFSGDITCDVRGEAPFLQLATIE